MQNRTQTADLLKGIAVILMIQVHIIELFATPDTFESVTGKFLLFLGGPPVAPVFAFILGYFIAASNKTTKQLIVRGLKTIALGMLLNIGLNLNLIISVSKGLLQVDLLPFLFGIDILQFAGLSIIIMALLRKSFEKSLPIGICLIVIIAGAGIMLENKPLNGVPAFLFAPFYGCCNWSYFPLLPWLAYPLSGMVFYFLQKKHGSTILQTSKEKLLTVIAFLLFITITLNYAINTSSNLDNYYHQTFFFVCWTLFFIGFYSFFVNEIEKVAGNFFLFKYFKWLGKNVTLVYVIQWLLIGNIATGIYKTVSSPAVLIGSYITILVASSSITWLWLQLQKRLKSEASC